MRGAINQRRREIRETCKRFKCPNCQAPIQAETTDAQGMMHCHYCQAVVEDPAAVARMQIQAADLHGGSEIANESCTTAPKRRRRSRRPRRSRR